MDSIHLATRVAHTVPGPCLYGRTTRDGNGYPLPTYPPGNYPLDVRVWDKKIPMGTQMEKIYTHRVKRVWVWDPKTHTHIPRYPSNSLTCGPPKYQRTKLIWCYYAQVWLFTRMCYCSQVCVVAYNVLLLNYGYMLTPLTALTLVEGFIFIL
jgi:hypothetical protein